VSVLGLGTVKLGRDQGVKYPTPVTIPSDDAARELLATARELGVNLLDTAPAYGTSEARLGTLLAGQRDEWVICSKVGETFENGHSTFDFSPGAILQSVDRSLARLRTDRLDILLLHSDGEIEADLVSSGVIDALQHVKRAGKAGLVGASTKTLRGAMHAIAQLDCIMVTLNAEHRADLPAIEAARSCGKGVLLKKIFASGHHALDPAQRAESLRESLTTPGVASAIVGTSNAAHLRELAALVQTHGSL
jgi:aryl-alcohol dehydrogenase-like predicted oxidoreductase